MKHHILDVDPPDVEFPATFTPVNDAPELRLLPSSCDAFVQHSDVNFVMLVHSIL